MSLTVVHAFVSGKSNGADNTLVQPSNWNAAHKLAGATTGDVLVASNSTTIAAVTAAQGVLYASGAASVPTFSMTPTLTSLTVTSFLAGPGSVATSGDVRLAEGSGGGIRFLKHGGGFDIVALYKTTADALVVGDSNTVGFVFGSGAVPPALSGHRYLQIDVNGNVTSSASAPVGT